jgi:phenylpropionate dioxygenase-like ring-hydroxylating dioxygenase large terminal subunit
MTEPRHALPPRLHVDDAVHALELEQIFRRDWLCVGRASDIARPGDYLTITIAGYSIMVVRQPNDAVIAMSRVCRHRGALLGHADGGTTSLFVCPYHHWTYTLDGQLRGAPAMGGNPSFDPKTCVLPRYRAEIWEGFIFIAIDPERPALAPRLQAVSERAAAYGLAHLRTAFAIEERWNVNWKIAVENASESYHHLGVHSATVQPAYPASGVQCEDGGEGYNLHIVPRAPSAAGSDGEPAPLNPRLDEAQRTQLIIVGIYPSLVLVFAGDVVTSLAFVPERADSTVVRVHWLAPPAYFESADFEERLASDRLLIASILEEDRACCLSVQQGLSSPDAVAGPLSPLERPVAQFGRYLRHCLGAPILK